MRVFKYLVLLAIALAFLTACDETTTDVNTVATPTFTPAPGTFGAAVDVTITCTTVDAVIRYTTNGVDPDSTSTIYTAPINVAVTTVIKARGYKVGMSPSPIATATYTINQVATPVMTPPAGNYTGPQTVTITCATPGAAIYYTLDGTEPTQPSLKVSYPYTAPITISANTTLKAKAFKAEYLASATATEVYNIFDAVSVAAGTFTMGRTTGTGYADELPTHSVTLNGFYIGKYEVTQAEWIDVMGTNPSAFVAMNKPVEMVSFYAVLVYCNKRSIAEGLTPVYTINGSTDPTAWGAIPIVNSTVWNAAICNMAANGYRLPTEAEWEYAARGATNNPDYLYAGSNTVNDVAWHDGNSAATQVVGLKQANGIGAYDMSGNVQEWVWDWYGATYYASSPSSNPTGPATNSENKRVIRGGGWSKPDSWCRVAFRNWGTPEKGIDKVFNNVLGFRVVRKM